MASYTYKIVTSDGKQKNGKLEADSESAAIEFLKSRGNTVIDIGNTSVLGSDISIPFLTKKVKVRDLSIFCRQMGTNLEAGVTIIKSLQIVEEMTDQKVLKNIIREIRISVEKGNSLAEAMSKHEKIFTTLFVNMISAGEASGNLERAFYQMAVHYEKSHKLQSLVKKAMIYPCCIGVVAIGVIFVMLVYVVPSFMTMFEGMDTEMPAYTMFVVGLSNWMVKYWYLVILIVFLLVTVIKMLARTDKGIYVVANIKLKIPLFGKLSVKTACAQFARNLSTLIAAGVPLINSMEIVARTMSNILYTDAIRDAKDQVARGIPMSEPLKTCKMFPPMVYNMVGIGEETGAMEQMLDKVADYYEEEVETTTAALSAMLEPILIIIMALIVIAIIAAVFAPMLTMYSSLDNL